MGHCEVSHSQVFHSHLAKWTERLTDVMICSRPTVGECTTLREPLMIHSKGFVMICNHKRCTDAGYDCLLPLLCTLITLWTVWRGIKSARSLLGFLSIQSTDTKGINKTFNCSNLSSINERRATVQGISKALYTRFVKQVFVRMPEIWQKDLKTIFKLETSVFYMVEFGMCRSHWEIENIMFLNLCCGSITMFSHSFSCFIISKIKYWNWTFHKQARRSEALFTPSPKIPLHVIC